MADEPDDARLFAQIAAHGGLDVPFEVGPLIQGYQGCYASEAAYLRQEVEDFIDPCVRWLLDCLDWDRVRDHFGDLQTLRLKDGSLLIFRIDDAPS